MIPVPDLKTLRFGAVLNTASGSCDAQAAQTVEECLAGFGAEPARIWSGSGADVDRALDEATSEGMDVLVVVGGDGTIRAAAERCREDGPLLIPLPGGTMNMLPKTLYGTRNWRDALNETLADPVVQTVHGGEVEGRRFFVAAIFGEPSRFADAREAVREGDLAGAIEKGVLALRKALAHELTYRFGNSPESKAEAVAVLCPFTSSALDNEEEVLEAAAIDLDGPVDALRLAITAAFSNWRNDATVQRAKLTSFDIASDVGIPALLDGERFSLGPVATVKLVRHAFRALKPRDVAPEI